MNSPADLQSLTQALQHAGVPVAGSVVGRAGSVRRGCAVQFSARRADAGMEDVRFLAFGGPEVVAACEYVARLLARGRADEAGRADDWRQALGLPRAMLGDLLIVEDALNGLLTSP